MRHTWIALACLLGAVCWLSAAAEIGDPYRILGIGRKATLPEIRKAYKKLAKEWHPDKTDQPNAEDKFVEIKQAYELLADAERRKAYDLHGITNEDASMFRGQHDYSNYERFATDPFEEFFGQRFPTDKDISIFHKLSITTKYYETFVVPQSTTQIYLLMFYADWCFSCSQAAPVFKKMIDTLEPLGITFATVNAGHEDQLVRRTGVHSLPCVVLVVDGKNYVYKNSVFSVPKVVEFIRSKFPYKMLRPVNDATVNEFLGGWQDNRVRGLVLEPRAQPRLRYLVTAFRFRKRVAFGFVQLNDKNSARLVERYKVHPSLDTVLLFNEDSERPVASVAMTDIPTTTLNNVVSTNQYLALPRLSSQDLLEGLCPAEWNRPRKRLCVILVTANTDTHNDARRALRRIALESGFSAERVRFAYIYQEKQAEFVSALRPNSRQAEGDTLLRLVIIWRRDASHIKYEWVSDVSMHWSKEMSTDDDSTAESVSRTDSPDDATTPTPVANGADESTDNGATPTTPSASDATGKKQNIRSGSTATTTSANVEYAYNHTKQKLDSNIQRLLRSSEALTYEAHVKDLLDEHAVGVLALIVHRILMAVEYFGDNIGREHILPIVSSIGSVAFVVGIGYLMMYLVRVEEEKVQKRRSASNNNDNKPGAYVPELKLHELRAEKYFGLVRMLKPGFRTIVLLTDMQSRAKLIPGFHKAVWPYRKNKTLMFSHMLIEKGQNWYAELLRLSMPDASDLNINPRNCIGTVLALNGHRKYFCMYHAKHPETVRGDKRLMKMTRQLSRSPADPEAGAFLGMDSDSDEELLSAGYGSDNASILLEENLLDGLSNWLDRLFEGSTHRYYINYWPDFTTK